MQWRDEGEEVVVEVSVPEKTKSQDVSCKIDTQHLYLSIATQDEPEVVNGELFQEVDPEGSTWSLMNEGGERKLVVTLAKQDAITGRKPRWMELTRK